jgi:hypothetical protein
MALMSDVDLPVAHVRAQVASAIDLVVHTARLRDAGGSVFQIAGVDDLDGAGEPVVIEVFGQRDHSRGQARAHERTVPADPRPDFSSQETSNLEFSNEPCAHATTACPPRCRRQLNTDHGAATEF